ncbi:MAG: DEAD/DEAH box helicase family protein [Methylovulum sp.]|nr:DEAD/DEAH box helicase family protein [Methylovulum sp.]
MRYFEPKTYQKQVLSRIEEYFKACHTLPSPSLAFYSLTTMPYNGLSGFSEDMPYFCLRIPTGGGKTWLAAKSVKLINTHLLRSGYSVILWLVPSNQIKEQTLKGLKDLNHPLHAALREAGDINVLALDEAQSVTAATLNTSTTVIVATRQAFQVENEEGRKVYSDNGALMSHFEALSPEQRSELLRDDDTVAYSLANALRLRRPFIIVDEAHNSRTELGFDTLAKFNPSGIMELTATPDTEKTPSNVLHSVSAVELKTEEMIKLPIRLETEPDWQKCLGYAIACRNELHVLAEQEQRQGAAYLRPVVLIQAEPKRAGFETLDVYKVRDELITNHAIPEHEIVVATGEERGLRDCEAGYALGISDPVCPVKFVITQKALAEGWDCPFAYILVSMAAIHSSTAVEQLLGRILRQPDASHRHTPELNRSYAFVVSRYFSETAEALRDRLVSGAGFDRKDLKDFIQATKPDQFDLERLQGRIKSDPVAVQLSVKPVFKGISKPLKEKLVWDNGTNTLTINAPLTLKETEELKATVDDLPAQNAIEQAAESSRTTAITFIQSPSERGEVISVPQLAVYIQGELKLFDETEMLDYPWDLSLLDATPTADDISKLKNSLKSAESGELDVTEQGKTFSKFMANLQRNLDLVYVPEHWTETKLAAWFCRQLHDPTVTHESKLAFVSHWLQALLADFQLAHINQQKFFIRVLLEQRIDGLRKQAAKSAYQSLLFSDEVRKRVCVGSSYLFDFHPQQYSPSSYYEANSSEYGFYLFNHHYYPQIGDFDSKEEFECACRLDQLAERQKIKFWVRNLVKKPTSSFFFQQATGRYYPDFICKLPDASILIVEYKGKNGWKEAEPDRLIGGLWAELSGGKCQFIMVTEKRWDLLGALVDKHSGYPKTGRTYSVPPL